MISFRPSVQHILVPGRSGLSAGMHKNLINIVIPFTAKLEGCLDGEIEVLVPE